jgi:hypothetical protein
MLFKACQSKETKCAELEETKKYTSTSGKPLTSSTILSNATLSNLATDKLHYTAYYNTKHPNGGHYYLSGLKVLFGKLVRNQL